MAGGPPPHQISLRNAASAAKGADPISKWTKALDLLVMVIVPLSVPAIVLWVTRARWDGLGLLDVSFGFVGIAVATLTKAVTNKQQDWLTIALCGAVASLFFVGVAAVVDRTNEITDLVSLAGSHDAAFVRDNAASVFMQASWILSHQPLLAHWVTVCGLGLLLTVATSTLIFRER